MRQGLSAALTHARIQQAPLLCWSLSCIVDRVLDAGFGSELAWRVEGGRDRPPQDGDAPHDNGGVPR